MRRSRLRAFGAAARNPLVVLACVALLNGAIYWLFFVRPWNLVALHEQPLLDLRRLSADEPLARWRLLGGLGALSLLYWLGWRAAMRARGRAAWALVLASAAAFGTVLLFLYPFDAADVFDNVMHGRLLAVYGANPFRQVAADFRGDPFSNYVAWPRSTSAYGPGWELVAGAAARLAGDGIVANVVAFKLVGGLFLTGCTAIVAALLRRRAPQRALAGTLLIAWNPLILYETLGQGHNDVAMAFWILLSIWWLARGRRVRSVLALVVGVLFKFVPLLLLPAAVLVALRSLRGTAARLRFVALTSAAAAVLVVLAYAPFWHGPETLGVERRRGLYTSSFPAVVIALLQPSLEEGQATSHVSLAAGIATALLALQQGVLAGRAPSWQSLARAAFMVLTIYLLFACLWFQQWYAVWPLAIVPLLPPGLPSWWANSFGLAVLLKPLVFEPIWLWTHPAPDRSWLELRLGPSVQATPWLLTLAALWTTRRRRASRR
jgi:alpha-1,6-mannosyltransferase